MPLFTSSMNRTPIITRLLLSGDSLKEDDFLTIQTTGYRKPALVYPRHSSRSLRPLCRITLINCSLRSPRPFSRITQITALQHHTLPVPETTLCRVRDRGAEPTWSVSSIWSSLSNALSLTGSDSHCSVRVLTQFPREVARQTRETERVLTQFPEGSRQANAKRDKSGKNTRGNRSNLIASWPERVRSLPDRHCYVCMWRWWKETSSYSNGTLSTERNKNEWRWPHRAEGRGEQPLGTREEDETA